MKLLIDMNLPPILAERLAEAGIEAIHWFSIGAHDAKDEEILSYARDNDLVLVTSDLDFSTILAITQGSKPSVVQLRLHAVRAERDTPIIAAAVQKSLHDLEQGAILTIDTKRNRLRSLPLFAVAEKQS